jgi:hypothetical protein
VIEVDTQQFQGPGQHLIGGQTGPTPEVLDQRAVGAGDVDRYQGSASPVAPLPLDRRQRRGMFARLGASAARHRVTIPVSSPGGNWLHPERQCADARHATRRKASTPSWPASQPSLVKSDHQSTDALYLWPRPEWLTTGLDRTSPGDPVPRVRCNGKTPRLNTKTRSPTGRDGNLSPERCRTPAMRPGRNILPRYGERPNAQLGSVG